MDTSRAVNERAGGMRGSGAIAAVLLVLIMVAKHGVAAARGGSCVEPRVLLVMGKDRPVSSRRLGCGGGGKGASGGNVTRRVALEAGGAVSVAGGAAAPPPSSFPSTGTTLCFLPHRRSNREARLV